MPLVLPTLDSSDFLMYNQDMWVTEAGPSTLPGPVCKGLKPLSKLLERRHDLGNSLGNGFGLGIPGTGTVLGFEAHQSGQLLAAVRVRTLLAARPSAGAAQT